MKPFFILLISLGLVVETNAQKHLFTFGVKFTGLAIHPKKKPSNGEIYKWKLDKLGRFVLNRGITFTANVQLWKFLGVGVGQTIMPFDCGGKWAGASQIGIAFLGNFGEKHSLNGIVGPTVFYRENWALLPNYTGDDFYKITKNNKIQYKTIWYAGNLEYTYWNTKNIGVSLNLLPGFPELLEISSGISTRNKK
jgi:hypothetical protein